MSFLNGITRTVAPRLFRSQAIAVSAVFLMSLTVSGVVSAQSADTLEQAYQKEFAFLEEQQRNLKKRLATQKKSQSAESRKLEQQIDALNRQLLDLDNNRQQLNEQISEVERELETANVNQDAFNLTQEQAVTTLSDLGITLNINPESDAFIRISDTYAAGLSAIERFSSIHSEQGTFFAPTGEKISGELVHLGQIAAYGIGDSAESTGSLVPIGDGNYKLLPMTGAPDTALTAALKNGDLPESLPIFLFEGNRKAIDIQKQETWLEYIQSGGIVAWVIVGLGALALLLIFLRSIFLSRAGSSGEKILKKLQPHLSEGKINEALAVCKKFSGSTSRVVQATLRNITRDREHVEDIISESILHESPRLNRFSALIMVIASIAPLLGLLGTVTGMISTFDIITEFGTGDPKLLSGGISTALVTTQLGLVIAIPALVLGNLLSGWSNRIKDDMEKMALTVVNIYGEKARAV